jgi:hypothetical protein
LTSWKVKRNSEVIFEGPMDMVINYLKSLGEKLHIIVNIKDAELDIKESEVKFDHSDAVRLGMLKKQLETYRRYANYVDDPEYKFCTACKSSKHRSNFGYRSNSPDGLARRCKECVNKAAKRTYKKSKKKN